MTTQSFSVQSCVQALFFASLILISGMYIELRYRYRELSISCRASTPQHPSDVTGSCSCAIACSDYCRNVARTEHDHLFNTKVWPTFFKDDFETFLTTVAKATETKELASENILPSNPAAFKTSETVLITPPMKYEESHVAASNLLPASSLDNLIEHSKVEMTSTLSNEVRGVPQKNLFNMPENTQNDKPDSLISTNAHGVQGNNIKHLEKFIAPDSSMSVFTEYEQRTGLPINIEKEKQLVLSLNNMHPTAFPLLQTSSSDLGLEKSSTSQTNLYHNILYDIEALGVAKTKDRDTVIMEEMATSKDFCDKIDCQKSQPEFDRFSALDINNFLYDDEHHYDDAYMEDFEDGTQYASGQKLFSQYSDESFLSPTTDNETLQRLRLQGTTMWCDTTHGGEEFCRFKNLCFNTKERDFVFVQGQESALEYQSSETGKTDKEDNFFSINLSAVPDHNAHTFPLVFLPAESLQHFHIAFIKESSFVMSRFKPDNVMHVLHDDLIPLVHTLAKRGFLHYPGKSPVRLILADLFDPQDNADLYSSIFSEIPVSFLTFNDKVDLVCLEDSYTGLSQATLWYQYGFFKPQGPLLVNGSEVLKNVHKATEYLSKFFETPCLFCNSGNYLVLFSRKDNRLIINEGTLVMSIVRATSLKVMSVSLETHSVKDIISIVKGSRGIIGIHGSLLIFGIFLQHGSIFIELFPYGVNPLKYTPFKTYCDLTASGIVYKSWSNLDRSKTVGHPYRLPELGGIQHLPPEAQAEILSQTEVPSHLCCKDPSWLYHVYQDTEVDIDSVVTLITAALAEASMFAGKGPGKSSQKEEFGENLKFDTSVASSTSRPQITKLPQLDELDNAFPLESWTLQVQNDARDGVGKDHPVHAAGRQVKVKSDSLNLVIKPARVQGLSCELSMAFTEEEVPAFSVTWAQPWNIKYLTFSSVHYELVYQAKDAVSGETVQLDTGVMEFFIPSKTVQEVYYVWVRAVLDFRLAGPYQFTNCMFDGG